MPDESGMTDARRKQIVDTWKVIVEVQRHFNDISMRIRGMFVTILLALFASLGFLLDKKFAFEIGHFKVLYAVVLPIFGVFGTYLFYFVDRHWYHRLLLGSVKHAMDIEKKYKNEMPELSLSDAIGKESPYKPRGVIRLLANMLVTHDKYRETGQLHSEGKIEFFYRFAALGLIITTLGLAVVGGITVDEEASLIQPTPGATTTSVPVTSPITPLPVEVLTSPLPMSVAPTPPITPVVPPASSTLRTE